MHICSSPVELLSCKESVHEPSPVVPSRVTCEQCVFQLPFSISSHSIFRGGLLLFSQPFSLLFLLIHTFLAHLLLHLLFTFLHPAHNCASIHLHTRCSPKCRQSAEEWAGELGAFISQSDFSNWKIHENYLVSHRRALCRLVELYTGYEMNLASRFYASSEKHWRSSSKAQYHWILYQQIENTCAFVLAGSHKIQLWFVFFFLLLEELKEQRFVFTAP